MIKTEGREGMRRSKNFRCSDWHGNGDGCIVRPSKDANDVMGFPDNLKLRSSMTLFALADPSCPVFRQVLDKFFGGRPDERTKELLGITG